MKWNKLLKETHGDQFAAAYDVWKASARGTPAYAREEQVVETFARWKLRGSIGLTNDTITESRSYVREYRGLERLWRGKP